ncbi:MAG: M28 family peptidase [bacterium]|nr:M28 family peptidase [bacterium]
MYTKSNNTLIKISAALLMMGLLWSGCHEKAKPDGSVQSTNYPLEAAKVSPNLPKNASDFKGERAWRDLVYQVELGERYVGSPGHFGLRQWLQKNLQEIGCTVYEQKFTAQTPEGPKEMANIIAVIPPGHAQQPSREQLRGEHANTDQTEQLSTQTNIKPNNQDSTSAKASTVKPAAKQPLTSANTGESAPRQGSKAIILGAHYDTKHFQEFPFVGANDGASGVAALLELARVFKAKPLDKHKLILVFFDGEEAFKDWNSQDSLYGSTHFVRNLGQSAAPEGLKANDIVAAIILDMIGDKNLRLTYDTISHPQLIELLFSKGNELLFTEQFKRTEIDSISDDHFPFLLAQIPAIDIIGFNQKDNAIYPEYWHTQSDTLDKVCADSLQIVGSTVDLFLRDLDKLLE